MIPSYEGDFRYDPGDFDASGLIDGRPSDLAGSSDPDGWPGDPAGSGTWAGGRLGSTTSAMSPPVAATTAPAVTAKFAPLTKARRASAAKAAPRTPPT